jgi:hypothetical protein
MGQTQLFFQRFPTSVLHYCTVYIYMYMNNMNSVIWGVFYHYLNVLLFRMTGSG